jgi:hypothetical protein
MYQLLYALYSGWNTIAFQHWDLKEANVMVSDWPVDVTKLCMYHTDAADGGKCITNEATQSDGKLLRMIDFDLSTSGGIDTIPRVKYPGGSKDDATSLKAMFENIRPDGVKSADETDFLGLLDLVIGASPACGLDTITPEQYTALSVAYSNAMKAAYFADLEGAPLPSSCTGACATAISTAVFFPVHAFLEKKLSVRQITPPKGFICH